MGFDCPEYGLLSPRSHTQLWCAEFSSTRFRGAVSLKLRRPPYLKLAMADTLEISSSQCPSPTAAGAAAAEAAALRKQLRRMQQWQETKAAAVARIRFIVKPMVFECFPVACCVKPKQWPSEQCYIRLYKPFY